MYYYCDELKLLSHRREPEAHDLEQIAHAYMDEFTVDQEEFESDLEMEGAERKYRSLGMLAIAGAIAVFGALVLINSLPEVGEVTAYTLYQDVDTSTTRGEKSNGSRRRVPSVAPPAMVLSRMKVLDTVYTTDSVYLDVNLTKQNVAVRFRNGKSHTFRISSGNKFIREGMSTPAGLFTVQNMVPMAISRQFNDARLHHWIGIQGGVGFHGLDGNGYYGYLGVRPSSHGCVRMAREEIAEMYKLVHPGALIMVHYGNPARMVAFCDVADTAGAIVIDSAAVYNRGLGKERLRALYEGRFWVDPGPRLVHLARQRVRWGMEIGESSRIPKQEMPRASYLDRPNAILRIPRPDRSRVETLRGDTYFALQRAADSTRKARQAAWKEEERRTDYRE
jgi:L,D-transpeptidase catalytic domain